MYCYTFDCRLRLNKLKLTKQRWKKQSWSAYINYNCTRTLALTSFLCNGLHKISVLMFIAKLKYLECSFVVLQAELATLKAELTAAKVSVSVMVVHATGLGTCSILTHVHICVYGDMRFTCTHRYHLICTRVITYLAVG